MVPENPEEGIFDHTSARGTHFYFMGASPHTPFFAPPLECSHRKNIYQILAKVAPIRI